VGKYGKMESQNLPLCCIPLERVPNKMLDLEILQKADEWLFSNSRYPFES
jgi:hypothetical protein